MLPVKQFKSTKDLEDLKMLAQERDVWKDFLNIMFCQRPAKKHFYKSKWHRRYVEQLDTYKVSSFDWSKLKFYFWLRLKIQVKNQGLKVL